MTAMHSLGVFTVVMATAAGAQARDVDIQWRVAIPGPVSVVIGSPAPRVLPPVLPPVLVPVHSRGHGWGDADRDGIPNRYDRVYNPRWDRDGDGIPNRHDRYDNRRGHDHHRDRHHDHHRDHRHHDDDRRGR